MFFVGISAIAPWEHPGPLYQLNKEETATLKSIFLSLSLSLYLSLYLYNQARSARHLNPPKKT